MNMSEDELRSWGINRSWSAPLMWLHFSPDDFLIRLNQRQPIALLIFAHFGVLLHGLTNYWFFHGWGQAIVAAVDELLGDYWSDWMQWPRDAVKLEHERNE